MIGALVASGDVDELRLALQGMLQPNPCHGDDAAASTDASPPKLQLDPPTDTTPSTVADAAGDGASAAEDRTELIQSCGLTLRRRMVMGGAAVWPAAMALADWLRAHPRAAASASVVELGAGAGAPGLVCASLGARWVLLTDGDDDLLSLLRDNAALNQSGGAPPPEAGALAPDRTGRVQCACLDWRDAAQVQHANRTAREKGEGKGWAGAEGARGCSAAPETEMERSDCSLSVTGDILAGGGPAAAQYTFPPLGTLGAGGAGAFDLVLAADVLFGVGDIEPLVRAAVALLRRPRVGEPGACVGTAAAGTQAPLGEEGATGAAGEVGRLAAAERAVMEESPEPAPRVLLSRSNFFEGLVPTLVAAFEHAGMRLHATHRGEGVEAAVIEFRWG